MGEEDSDNAVSLPMDYVGQNNKQGERRVVRLDEVVPQMELKLVKIVEGVPGKEGSVIYHELGGCVCPVWGMLLMRVLVTKLRMEEARQHADHAAKELKRMARQWLRPQRVLFWQHCKPQCHQFITYI